MDLQTLLPALIAVGIMLLVAFPVHEFSHALAAYRLGDSTARYQGRLTLDPRVHFDPLGGGMLVLSAILSTSAGSLFFFGYARPTPVNSYNLQGGRRGEALVGAAGPLSNLVMAALVAAPLRVVASSPDLINDIVFNDAALFIFNIAVFFVIINVFLFLFNLIPIPPLDGWRVLLGLVDARTAYQLRQVEQYALVLILVVFLLGGQILRLFAAPMLDFLLGPVSPF